MDLVRLTSQRRALALVVAAHVVAGLLGALVPPERKAEAQLLSPGPLSRDHADLEGDDKCNRCHSEGRRVSTPACLRCHSQLAGRIRARQGLHGREYQGRDCGGCHVEHVGRNAAQIRWPGGDKNRFDHRLSGWPLEGGHADVRCDQCHRGRSFLGLRTACNACHEDPHQGRFGTTCTQCHTVRTWNQPTMTGFDHARTRYPLVGAHARVQCARCHTGSPPRYRGLEFASCSNCHQDPHQGRFEQPCANCHVETSFTDLDAVKRHHPGLSLANGHARTRCNACHDRGLDRDPSRGTRCVSCHREVHDAPFGNDCADCHRSIQWTGLSRSVGLGAHGRTPFPLHGKHEDVACGSCHPTSQPAQQRYRELTFDTCRACHRDDPHRGEFARYEQGECGGCHVDTGFAPTTFDLARHARTDFPLEGRHEAVACGQCHEAPRPRLDWHLDRSTCADCHANPHGDQFAREMRDDGCAHCHSTSGWDRPRIDHTAWPLTGAHARAACDACHHPSAEDRQTGRGASYRGVPRECESCHADVHAGQFRRTEPRKACDDCHSTESFPLPGFEHERRTGFALDGRHADVACGGCHASRALRDRTQVVAYRLGYRRCRDCHANPHVERPTGGTP
ncbi:MAG: DUF3716 domain-containing protein [Polyangiales bacterium]